MKTALLIMAAGIGSRFGTGIKQLEPVDDAGHIIMDYSIHDAIEAGFNHVVQQNSGSSGMVTKRPSLTRNECSRIWLFTNSVDFCTILPVFLPCLFYS